ncbi:MAG: gamma-glutamylcyclotransferase [Candidatus Helarchaeota archaeon]|nr:gamma-glutamylcyclotransferase [Candidatus Helarchaeota archaeon]
MHLFVYGTLTDEEFLHRVTRRPLGHFKIIKAKLPEYKRDSTIKISKCDHDSSVDGRLILNLDKNDLELLDYYESCNSDNAETDETNWYNRKIVSVITSDDETFNAFVYIPNF